jgi:SAM-dependent methyltransferase
MHDPSPSLWVKRFVSLLPAGASVLDVACGSGRHARWLAGLGYPVEAVDRDAQAIAVLAQIPGITARVSDLERDPWPYGLAAFGAVVVTHYLHRPRFAALIDALQPGGVFIYETFMVGNETLGKPSNPNFLLQPDELLERVRSKLSVVAFEQGRVEGPRPAFVQRICATAGPVRSLPESGL